MTTSVCQVNSCTNKTPDAKYRFCTEHWMQRQEHRVLRYLQKNDASYAELRAQFKSNKLNTVLKVLEQQRVIYMPIPNLYSIRPKCPKCRVPEDIKRMSRRDYRRMTQSTQAYMYGHSDADHNSLQVCRACYYVYSESF